MSCRSCPVEGSDPLTVLEVDVCPSLQQELDTVLVATEGCTMQGSTSVREEKRLANEYLL